MTKNGQVIHITPVEQALLSVLGAKSGQIFTREKLAEILGAGQSPRSIDVQITRLRKKLSRIQKSPLFANGSRQGLYAASGINGMKIKVYFYDFKVKNKIKTN